jgi:hypothetical protein
MLPYFLIAILLLLNWGINNKYFHLFSIVIVALFLCTGYMTGSDWRNYEIMYLTPLREMLDSRIEIGYTALQTFFRSVGMDFWLFHILLKLLVFMSLLHFLRNFAINIFLFLFIYLAENAIILFVDCPFRNLIALGLGFIAFNFLLVDNKRVFLVFSLLAVSFHYSAFFLFVAYLLSRLTIKSKYYIIMFVACNLVAYKVDILIDNIFLPVFGISPFLKGVFDVYVLNPDFVSSTINLGSIYKIAIFILIIWKRKYFEEEVFGNFVYKMVMLYLLIYPFTIAFIIFSRFALFVQPFFIISIIYLFNVIRLKVIYAKLGNVKKIVSFNRIYMFVIILYSFLKIHQVLSYDERYVPYSTYMQYVVEQDFPNYRTRDNYNYIHSPYKK